jgi:hypothetical protein
MKMNIQKGEDKSNIFKNLKFWRMAETNIQKKEE